MCLWKSRASTRLFLRYTMWFRVKGKNEENRITKSNGLWRIYEYIGPPPSPRLRRVFLFIHPSETNDIQTRAAPAIPPPSVRLLDSAAHRQIWGQTRTSPRRHLLFHECMLLESSSSSSSKKFSQTGQPSVGQASKSSNKFTKFFSLIFCLFSTFSV